MPGKGCRAVFAFYAQGLPLRDFTKEMGLILTWRRVCSA